MDEADQKPTRESGGRVSLVHFVLLITFSLSFLACIRVSVCTKSCPLVPGGISVVYSGLQQHQRRSLLPPSRLCIPLAYGPCFRVRLGGGMEGDFMQTAYLYVQTKSDAAFQSNLI